MILKVNNTGRSLRRVCTAQLAPCSKTELERREEGSEMMRRDSPDWFLQSGRLFIV